MSIKRTLSVALQAAAVLVVVSLVVGQFLGQPILLSYVETGSMQPTLSPGDGFVAIPAQIAGGIGPGDVVTFDAQEIQGGGLTTHRVVEETERGYITRGDNNPFTDQDGGEPVVQDAEVVAKALQVGGGVVVIPHLGTVAMGFQSALQSVQTWLAVTFGVRSFQGTQGLAYIVFGLSMVAYAVDWYLNAGTRDRDSRDRSRDDGTSVFAILGVLALVLMATATAAMVVPAGTQEYGVVSAEFESENPTVIESGTSQELEYVVPNAGLVPVYAYVTPASPGVDVDPERLSVASRGEASTTVTLSAPDETGYYRLFVVEHRYLAVLPPGIVDELYGVHPWAPLVAINGLLGGGIVSIGLLLLRGEPARIRSRGSRERPPLYKRLLREFYR
ncbi:peptidase S26B, signal peptidase [Halorubrum distributum JCM 9100]|uniref:Peptidase S26B, signal peptidase n=3 Tax=Halorubrum distributum TaxID=29283 RepID=M0F244_9EURY|nr:MULTISPECIES: signal peptidase I [Halorubrum distributum group]ELZ34302.1 peptidase S26B, signal peptidase [Halorubrum terrestre JCM 10247]ELZ54136.1 peptidase S26B, signal peptidase [Halorubrum distributum JCM 9100]ELZ54396.1 peptidase S26B, signal peptidase [Halorubrum distributum JCM 10118]